MSLPRPSYCLLLMLLVLGGCAGLPAHQEAPRVSLVHLRLLEMQLFEQRYELTLRIQNPGERALHISGMSFEVEINERGFAQGVSNQSVSIAGFDEALVKVEVASNLFDIVNQLREMQERQRDSISYRIHGRLKQRDSGFTLPFERSGEIGGRR